MQNGELGGGRIGAQATAHFEPVHVGQIDIQYDQVCLCSRGQGGTSGGSLQHLIPRGPQYAAGGIERRGIVVDREYPDRAGLICDCGVQRETYAG
jgi:hypothetical protein